MSESIVVRQEWETAAQLLQAAQKIIVITHIRPDGDAIGSLVAMGLALREHGKQITMVVDEGVPRDLRFIIGAEEVLSALPNPQADLVIVVDCSSMDRTGIAGEAAFALGIPSIIIDHHPTNTFWGTAHIVKSSYISTTEAILDWMDHLGWEFSQEVATALMMGLLTDTISFRVGPITADTFAMAQRLMSYGVDIRGISQRVFSRVPSGTLQLMGLGFLRLQIEDHVIWTALTLEDFQKMGFTTAQKPELSSELLTDENAYIAAFFLETEEGDIRVSFRSVPGFNVGAIAFSLGGGGHAQASGCTLYQTPLEDAIAKVIPLLKAEIQRGQPEYT